MNELQIFRYLFQLVRPFPLGVLAIVILGLAASLAEGIGLSLFLPFLESLNSGAVADAGSGFSAQLNSIFVDVSEESRIIIIPLFIFIAILLKNVLLFSNLAVFAWLNAKISHKLRKNIFSQLLTVSDRYLNTQDSGHLLNILASETWRTSEALEGFVKLIISGCTVVVFISLMLLLSWPLTLLVAITMLMISGLVRVLTRQVKQFGNKAVVANSQLTVRMCEGLAGMRTIRSFGRETYEQGRFDQASKKVSDVFLSLNVLGLTTGPTYEILGAILVLSILVIALSQNWVALPTLLIFVLILYRLQPCVKAIGNDYVTLLGLMSSVETVLGFLNTSDKSYVASGYRKFSSLKQNIQFANVDFRYTEDSKVAVRNISFSILCKQTTAFVGPSGAGKSTLINLLLRFYDPSAGTIFVDGQPLTELNTADWRSRIALVSQDIYLFSGTIYENIAYGNLDATKDEIISASKQANADEFISQLPNGYHTLIGDRGLRLSGGQRQRIALARAIVRNPEILILDEATNALDTLSEALIQEALERFSQNRTVIAIAHRLSTIEKADQIIVMKAGQIIETGNLYELLDKQGLFSDLYQLQYRHALSNN